jgi:hypothetical protein
LSRVAMLLEVKASLGVDCSDLSNKY